MFCQQCGKSLVEETQFCSHCGRAHKSPGISNKILLIAAVAAIISVGAALLGSLPRSNPIQAQGEPSPTVMIPFASPRASPSLKPTQKPKPTPTPEIESTPEPTPRPQRQRTEPTPDYPYKHTPTPESPVDGAVFSHYPRRLILHWVRNTASEAVKYKVSITHGSVFEPGWRLWQEIETSGDWYIEDAFPCACPGRWRVAPIFANGRSGIPTEWRTFRFTR